MMISTPNNKETYRDPVLEVFEEELKKKALTGGVVWSGYLSATSVYGDTKGAFVSEFSEALPSSKRGKGRLRAENEWFSTGLPMHVFRLPGIYGPDRGTLARLRKGNVRRIKKENQYFSRIHVDDIVGVLLASIDKPNPGRVYNVCDDLPLSNSPVVAFGAELLGIEEPPEKLFEEVKDSMSPMAQSFYTQTRRVENNRIKDELGYKLLYPTYKEGMRAQYLEEQNSCM